MVNEKRLIDVWDVIEWLDNFDRENTFRILRGKKAKLLNSHAIKNMIVTVPRVDAVEVVHSKWVLAEDGRFICDHCKGVKVAYEQLCYLRSTGCWNYCPNCGADMRGNKK